MPFGHLAETKCHIRVGLFSGLRFRNLIAIASYGRAMRYAGVSWCAAVRAYLPGPAYLHQRPAVGAAPTCAPKTATSNSNCGPYCPLIRARIPAVDWAGTKARASLAYGYRSAHELSRSQLDAAGRREGEEGEEGEGDIRPGPCISTQAHVFARSVDVLRSPSAGRPAGHQTEHLGS